VSFEEMRGRRGLDVGSLARLAGVWPAMVEKMERNEIVPLHIAWNVADALEMTQDERIAAYKHLLRSQRDTFNKYAASMGVKVGMYS
jgi:transcriptional regulator with XRE-family HTH domain